MSAKKKEKKEGHEEEERDLERWRKRTTERKKRRIWTPIDKSIRLSISARENFAYRRRKFRLLFFFDSINYAAGFFAWKRQKFFYLSRVFVILFKRFTVDFCLSIAPRIALQLSLRSQFAPFFLFSSSFISQNAFFLRNDYTITWCSSRDNCAFACLSAASRRRAIERRK